MKPILGIMGATGVGKSHFAVSVAQKLTPSFIISADSMQIYKGMDVGTAKISTDEMGGVKHCLLDVVEPDSQFSAYDFCVQATNLLNPTDVAIMVGGTGLYFDSFLYGLDFAYNDTTQKIRREMQHLYEEHGIDVIRDVLKEVDEYAYRKIDINNPKRIIRAIEIAQTGGSIYGQVERKPRYRSLLYVLSRNRNYLYKNIEQRVDDMFDRGLVDEAYELWIKYDKRSNLQAFQAIGYKEIIAYFEGKIKSMEESRNLIKLNTRHYAKRQICYFKRFKYAKWIDLDNADIGAAQDMICAEYKECAGE
ncbi:MAG: tRNA (adenosine(37)-N6)-dimethylallyltransferase MiaA [Corallococcus sp.]|nr:tRNA (adenosine(37)-N6)-dimethylallyltransferase MiaA [Corallococcus sp.]